MSKNRNETKTQNRLDLCEELSQQDMERVEGGGHTIIVCDDLVVKGDRKAK